MKEFMCILKQTNKVTKGNFWLMMTFLLYGVVASWSVTALLYFTSGVWNGMEVIVTLGMLGTTICICCFWLFPADFMCALSMGKTRKYLFGANYVLWLRNILVCMLGVLGICLIRDYIYSHFVKGTVLRMDEWSVLSNPLVFVTIVLCVPALILFLGGMRLFFGIKMFWGFAGLFVLCMGLGKLKERCPDFVVFQWFGASGGEPDIVAICLLCLTLGAIMLGLAWMALRKQRVVG